MILIYLFMPLLLYSLPLFHNSMLVCSENFSSLDLFSLKHPFFNATHKRCGLIKVHCTPDVKEIQLGDGSYEITSKLVPGPSISVHKKTFGELVEAKSCKALTYHFTSPAPLLYSISIVPSMTLFVCKSNTNYSAQVDAYFHQNNYSSYNRCEDHNIYFKYPMDNTKVPTYILCICETLQLPVKLGGGDGNKVDDDYVFSLLSSTFSITFKLTPSCTACNKSGRQCSAENGQFQCLLAKKEKHHSKLRLILVLAGSAFILMLSFVIFVIWHRRMSNPFLYVSSKDKSKELEDWSLFFGVSVFSYAELQDATQNFDPSRKLGDGGFGAVYHGKLQDGREVAVKRLYEHNYKQVQQFIHEVEILTRLRHPNLVVLYGCTSQQSRELLLVYEYVPNGTLADHLHGDRANPSLLTWPIRMNIARETACALAYLHASETIHQDVKTNNILLDHNFRVKVADFGLSRFLPNDGIQVSMAPQGTPGYVDPQHHQFCQLPDKSDVYSFGVVLVELISSMVAIDLSRPPEDISLANLAMNRIQTCAVDQLIDPALGSNMNAEILMMITSLAELAFLCLQFDSEMRPTMNEVLIMLEHIQAVGRIDTHDSINELRNIVPPPSSETIDTVALLIDHSHSATVMDEWHSCSRGSSRVSTSGDGLAMKNHISS